MSSQCSVDYNKCMYKDCKNGKSHGKRLFKFPMQKDARCNVWIRNTGRSLYNNYVLYFNYISNYGSLTHIERRMAYEYVFAKDSYRLFFHSDLCLVNVLKSL